MIYADQRWIGDHGIGRFARQILSGLDYRPVQLASHPALPLDSWKLARALDKLTHHDIFFSPGYNSPLFCSAPFVFTIHDLNHIDRPENSSLLKRLYYLTIMKQSCHRAARILTVSEFSRARIIGWSGVSPDKVINVGCGVDSKYSVEAAPCELPYPYLLCVSNRKPHKNEFRTVEAFARAGLADEIQLIFTGKPTAELVSCIGRNSVTQRVHFAGLVPDAQLPSYYRSAQALIYVSLYEGFGLPLLEAMACGTPVITSDISALPETAGGAAVLVDPTSVEQISGAINKVMNDTTLRRILRERGLTQAARYSWSNTTARVQEVLARSTV